MPDDLPLVGIPYGLGAGGPLGVIEAARGLCRIAWICDTRDEHTRAVLPLLQESADVVDVTDLTAEDSARILAADGVAGVTTFSERWIGWTAEVAGILGLPYHTPEVAAALTDKDVQRTRCGDAGVSPLRHRRIDDRADVERAGAVVGFPAILKPLHGAASRNTVTVTSPEELRRECARVHGAFVVEELLVGDSSVAGRQWGDQVSVETLSGPAGHRVLAVSGKFPLAPPWRETGTFYPSTLRDATLRTVEALAVAVLDTLGVRHGVSHTEVKLTADGPRLIEVNGRVGGGIARSVRDGRGPDLLHAALCAALARPFASPAETAPARVGQVGFEYWPPAPQTAGVVSALTGVREVRRLTGVRSFLPTARPGTRLDWRHGTLSHLGIVNGVVCDHSELARVGTMIRDALHVELTPEVD